MHYLKMFDSEWLRAHHLDGQEHKVTIKAVVTGELQNGQGGKVKKPVLHMEGRKLPLALNKTNGKTIARLFGPDTDAWIGKEITIYPTVTQMAGEEVECVRVKA